MLKYINIRLCAKKQMGDLLSYDKEFRLIIALILQTIEGLSIVIFGLFAWTQIQ